MKDDPRHRSFNRREVEPRATPTTKLLAIPLIVDEHVTRPATDTEVATAFAIYVPMTGIPEAN
ncbi:MAG: hypothetical protein WDN46_10070 [Methylocella sp.]